MAKKSNILEMPCSFGNISIGDKTARIGVSFGRSKEGLTTSKADRHLCDKRLTGTIFAAPLGTKTTNGQQALPGADGDLELEAVFDVKGFSVSSKHIGAGLTFALASIDVEQLTHFAKREGRIEITGVADLDPADEEEEG